ncbi:hypothetical protein [Asaia prunellae]|uniref:hypothetical protein n=1 Tax=Asaia prunellae TaxID=610245 RepID=UPI00047014DD|nr:hypothetical protein [Asaia prunellae]
MSKISGYDRTIVSKRTAKTVNTGNVGDTKRIVMTNVDNAPMIFADKVPVYGTIGDVVTTTLAAERPVGESIAIAATVHLRLTRDAASVLARSLLEALAIIDRQSQPSDRLN